MTTRTLLIFAFTIGLVAPLVYSQSKGKPAPKAKPKISSRDGTELNELKEGYAINPSVVKDFGCVKDWLNSLSMGGVEGEKLAREVTYYGCRPKQLTGVFRVIPVKTYVDQRSQRWLSCFLTLDKPLTARYAQDTIITAVPDEEIVNGLILSSEVRSESQAQLERFIDGINTEFKKLHKK